MRVPRFDWDLPQAGFARPVVDDRGRRFRLFKAPWFPEELGMFQAEWATPWGFIQLGGPGSSHRRSPPIANRKIPGSFLSVQSPTPMSMLTFSKSKIVSSSL